MKLKLLCVWAEPAAFGSTKTALKFIYKIQIGYYLYTIQCMGQFISFKSKINNPCFNPWFISLHTHSNVCATVEGRCLEYLVCITLVISQNVSKQVSENSHDFRFRSLYSCHIQHVPFNFAPQFCPSILPLNITHQFCHSHSISPKVVWMVQFVLISHNSWKQIKFQFSCLMIVLVTWKKL